ncbi:uncharacterized protein LOC133308742 [Gastrolobium bilobum]|uniref:uncharacterized protein LOC133308742 n=1 Tax=Gastrolobium bilobum TaxID=150636 RepID=UPI002AB26229|nr:uncharacterized protein LOC133308742 [Gastrolobium bilobum]
MANESVELPVTAEVTKSCRVGKKGYSTGKASSGNSDEKIEPHYLRASTGSCHDFCKYGRKHTFEEKERRSIPNRAVRKQLHQSSEESIGGKMTSVARLTASVDSAPTKKMSMVKLRESVDSKTRISDTSDATGKGELPTKSFDSQKQMRNEVVVNRKKAPFVKVKSTLPLKSDTSPLKRQEISSTPKKVESPSKSTSRKVESPSRSTPKRVETPSKSTSQKVDMPSKSTSQFKTTSKSTSKMVETSSQLSSSKGKVMKLSEKRVTSLNPNDVTRKQKSSMNSSEGFGGQRNSEIRMEKGAASSKIASRKLMAPLRALSSPKPSLKRVASINSRKHKSLKIVSPLKNQQTARKVELKEHNNNEVEEKTLYVITMESENKTLQSDQNAGCDDESYLPQLSSPKSSLSSISQSLSQEDQEESQYTTSEFEQDSFSGSHEIEYMENGDMLEVEKKGKLRKDGVVCSEDKNSQMMKLKFRRGKVIENEIEKNSPRRLKFRRGKVLGQKANVKTYAQRKSFKRRDGTCADSNDATTGPEKVVLRHQDMQDKKDAQGLFNNVIEETASKLVETRKSKVKALVGAFETVISLQEKKPPADTVR